MTQTSQRPQAIRPGRRLRALILTGVIAAFLSLSMITGLAHAEPQADAIVRCDPAVILSNNGKDLTVDIYVQDVVALYGADVELSFDPAVVCVKNASDCPPNNVLIQPLSGFLVPNYVIRKIADNTAGTIRYAVTQTSPRPPVSGSGGIARVIFHAFQAGEYTLNFTFHELGDRDVVIIPTTTQNCSIGFWGPIDLAIAQAPAGHDLSWAFLGNSISRAEMWRSTTNPYLLPPPDDSEATELLPGPAAGATTFTDNSIDSNVNQYYIARAVHGDGTTKSAPSNRVGAFHFALVPGTAP